MPLKRPIVSAAFGSALTMYVCYTSGNLAARHSKTNSYLTSPTFGESCVIVLKETEDFLNAQRGEVWKKEVLKAKNIEENGHRKLPVCTEKLQCWHSVP